jgi:GR25 family glycosyltransferase involved in LPS biosynthesis
MNLSEFMCGIPVYIINLPDSVDRQQHIQKEFKDYKNIKFIEAVDGRDT